MTFRSKFLHKAAPLDGIHPVKHCAARLAEHQNDMDTNFTVLQQQFDKGYPASGNAGDSFSPERHDRQTTNYIPAVPKANLDAILQSKRNRAPARLKELQQQLAEAMAFELARYGPHKCGDAEVSEDAVKQLYAQVNA